MMRPSRAFMADGPSVSTRGNPLGAVDIGADRSVSVRLPVAFGHDGSTKALVTNPVTVTPGQSSDRARIRLVPGRPAAAAQEKKVTRPSGVTNDRPMSRRFHLVSRL